MEFEINKDYVGRIVGSHGAAVNRLRDSLGVRVDFSDEVEDREKEGSKKKKTPVQKAKVKVILSCPSFMRIQLTFVDKITGRKENVEEAKKRILTQADRLVSIPHYKYYRNRTKIETSFRQMKRRKSSKFLRNITPLSSDKVVNMSFVSRRNMVSRLHSHARRRRMVKGKPENPSELTKF